jgi:hypothetical protein
MPQNFEIKDENGRLICQINKSTKKGKYYIFKADKQKDLLSGDIYLEGFDRLPSGFYKEGFGLTMGGSWLLRELYTQNNKKITLTITTQKSSTLDLRGKAIKLTLSEDHLSNLANDLRLIRKEKNMQMKTQTQNFLGTTFKQFKSLKGSKIGYIPGNLSVILANDDSISKLNSDDKNALDKFIPDYLESIPGTLRSQKKLQVIYDAMDAGKKIYLEKVLKEFRSKLRSKTLNENSWQKFLSDYILVIQSNYGQVLEKQSVSLQGKFPDFMLIDPYGYLDIYEIKKPATNLLKLDKSRNNYYWDVELSKAVSQVENYIHQVQRNADVLITDIRKAKAIDINIVRPRGFIIAGQRGQLGSSKMNDDFRILCDSLKNVDVILYDDLLESLETFLNRAASSARDRSTAKSNSKQKKKAIKKK